MTEMVLRNDTVKVNYRNTCNGIDLLQAMKRKSVKAVFFDPQYRGVLDKLTYGNEGEERGKSRSSLPQMTEERIKFFLSEINRVLCNSGYLFLWVDKYHFAEGISSWLKNTDLSIVDMIVWNKGKIGMGYRTRRTSEYLLILQKRPAVSKGTWSLHDIPDVWEEKVKKNHPHSKPIELQKQLILSCTNEGDFVCDPASGGYSVFEACKQTNRNFIGGDIVFGDE